MLVREAPIRWWNGSTCLPSKPEASFEPIVSLFPEKSASATLVQCLIEMTVTPYDFYRMTSLSFEGAIISLDGVSGV